MGYDTRENGNKELFFFLGFFVILTVVIGLVVAVTYKSAPTTPSVAGPRVSVVSLPEGVSEFCDGNNMVYLTAQALAVAPNDERCGK